MARPLIGPLVGIAPLVVAATAAMAQDTAPTVNVQGAPAGGAAAAGTVPPPPSFVVLARTDKNEVVTTSDLPLVLTKAQRQEQAVVRRAIYYQGSVSLTQPANLAPDDPVVQTCRWSYKAFLLREVCFTSMSGLFACTQPEVADLTEAAEGQADLTAEQAGSGACTEGFTPVAAARTRLVATLRARAEALFDQDQKAKVEPLLKAGGVSAARPPQSGRSP